MKSNKQRKVELSARRERAKEKALRRTIAAEIEAGRALPVDRERIVSRSVLPRIPEFYRDLPFVCRDCGKDEVWTARQQKWWYEVAAGEIETTAIRCRECRAKARRRKEAARMVHLDGIRKKTEGK
jgi:DNA-directed RNA polymerase subunit M/transcription elongation factor TFIIS